MDYVYMGGGWGRYERWHGSCGLWTWMQEACQRGGLFGWVEEGFEGAVAGGGGLVGEDCVYVDLRLLDVRD